MVRIVITTLLLCLPLAGLAVEPNIEPGEWRYITTTRLVGTPVPDQTHQHTECVTLDDVRRGEAFTNDVEGCELTDQEMQRDRMRYSMNCVGPEGTAMTMKAEMRFMGRKVEGTMEAEAATPMGAMQMQVTTRGERLGECR